MCDVVPSGNRIWESGIWNLEAHFRVALISSTIEWNRQLHCRILKTEVPVRVEEHLVCTRQGRLSLSAVIPRCRHRYLPCTMILYFLLRDDLIWMRFLSTYAAVFYHTSRSPQRLTNRYPLSLVRAVHSSYIDWVWYIVVPRTAWESFKWTHTIHTWYLIFKSECGVRSGCSPSSAVWRDVKRLRIHVDFCGLFFRCTII